MDEIVILLHGLGRTPRSMRPIQRRLEKEGYRVHNLSYPSTRHTIEVCSSCLNAALSKIVSAGHRVSFVTHSMGGLVLRHFLSHHSLAWQSIVMLCPPNQGSTLAAKLSHALGPLFLAAVGPAGKQLGKGGMCIVNNLPTLDGKVGIIAGDKSVEPYFSWLIPERDDGKVGIEETHLAEMSDFLVLHHSHSFIMNSADTQDQIVYFLRHHQFCR
ncbi:MAG: alpha/beta fold hydrolase [Cyanobacteria bacterium J06627_15]